MKVMIIGAGGFIGSHLHRYFSINNTVIPISRGDLNLLDEREVREFLTGATPDVVINSYSAGSNDWGNDTSLDVMATNLIMFDNFRRNKNLFNKYINIGSGAEFTKEGICHEEDILRGKPTTSYGLSKNLIARMCLQEPNFYTLRLFGCFGIGESPTRLFTKYLSSKEEFVVDDKYFDNIPINFFISIMNEFVTKTPPYKDINCVYSEKLLISQQLKMLSEVTGHVRPITSTRGKDYIGSGSRLKSLGIKLPNLISSMSLYK